MLIVIAISVAYNRSVMNSWNPPESLVGKWTGQSEISAPFKKGQSPSKYPEDWINIEIVIKADGNVIGTIGDAELVNCTVKQNRTWFERLVRIKTDYIVRGYLKNRIVKFLQDILLIKEAQIRELLDKFIGCLPKYLTARLTVFLCES